MTEDGDGKVLGAVASLRSTSRRRGWRGTRLSSIVWALSSASAPPSAHPFPIASGDEGLREILDRWRLRPGASSSVG